MTVQSYLSTKQAYQQIQAETLHLWEQAHGNRVSVAHTLTGEDFLAIFLPQALSQAELKLTQKKVGKRVLKRYLGELMDWVMVNQSDKIKQTTGRQVQEHKTYLDPEVGWIMFYFKLGSPTS